MFAFYRSPARNVSTAGLRYFTSQLLHTFMQTNNIVVDMGPAYSPSTEPVTAQELYDHLMLNVGLVAVQTQLEGFVTAARQQFEFSTDGRIVVPTVFHQHLTEWPDVIRLARGPVLEVSAVAYYDGDDVVQELDAEADLSSVPALVYSPTFTYPSLSTTKPRPITVEYVAGMETVNADIKLAILLLASHWYLNREACADTDKKEVPMGFMRVANKYRTGVQGW